MALTRSEKIVKDSLERAMIVGEIAVWFRPVEIRHGSIQHSLPFDFWFLSKGGKFVSIEVKEIQGKSFPLGNIRESQWESSKRIAKTGSISVAIVAFKRRRTRARKWTFIAVDLEWLRKQWKLGMKSIKPRDLLICPYARQMKLRDNYGVTEKGQVTLGMDLLKVLQVKKSVLKRIVLVSKHRRVRV